MNLAVCKRLPTGPERGTWFRAFDPRHMPTPLSSAHTLGLASRFSPGPLDPVQFEILYVTQGNDMALREVNGLLGPNSISDPNCAWLTINVEVQLRNVLDLTVVSHQNRLRTSAQELTRDWEGYSMRGPRTTIRGPRGSAPTQVLGKTLFDLPDLEGFRTISAKVPHRMNLVIFPQKLLRGSWVSYYDSSTQTTHEVKG